MLVTITKGRSSIQINLPVDILEKVRGEYLSQGYTLEYTGQNNPEGSPDIQKDIYPKYATRVIPLWLDEKRETRKLSQMEKLLGVQLFNKLKRRGYLG